jgi:hypothetical protein
MGSFERKFMRVSLALLLALGACTPAEENGTGNDIAPAEPSAIGSAQSGAEGQAMAEEQVKAAESAGRPEGAAPPGVFQWTGRFAVNRDLCQGGVWEFTNVQVRTSGENVCSISKVGEGGGKVELRLSCSAEGMWTDEKWTLLPRETGGMNVSRSIKGGGRTDVDLIRCG